MKGEGFFGLDGVGGIFGGGAGEGVFGAIGNFFGFIIQDVVIDFIGSIFNFLIELVDVLLILFSF